VGNQQGSGCFDRQQVGGSGWYLTLRDYETVAWGRGSADLYKNHRVFAFCAWLDSPAAGPLRFQLCLAM